MKDRNQLLLKLVVFTVRDKLRAYLENGGLPVVSINSRETLDNLAVSLFERAFGIALGGNYLEQLYTFSEEGRRVISYFVLLQDYKIAGKIRKFFIDTDNLSGKMADNHVIHYAVQRLRWKIEYTNAVYSLLPNEFTFSELQQIYEAILGRKLDKRNFRKKILSLKILKDTKRIKNLGRARPAEMFAFRKKKLEFVRIL